MNKYFYFQPRNFRFELSGSEGCPAPVRLKPEMKCGIGVGVGVGGAILGGSILGAGAGIFGAMQQSNATRNAANSAANSQQNANQLNYQQFLLSRGSGGSAVLPTYLQLPGGGLFEGQLGSDLVSGYQGSNVPLSRFQSAADRLAPSEAGAEDFTNQIFSGGVTNRLLSEAAPTQSARLALAKSTSMDALNRTLAAIDASQAGKGFSGDSYANRMVGFGARKTAGEAISGATLQNLGENQQIRNYGDVTLPMQNLNLPYTMGQQAGNFAFLPQANWLQSLQSRMSPLSFLRIGQGAPFQFQSLPTAPPITSNAGLAAMGVGQLGGSAMNYYLNQQAQQNLLNHFTMPGQVYGANRDFYSGNPDQSYAPGASLMGYNAAAAASNPTSFGPASFDVFGGGGGGGSTFDSSMLLK